MQANKFDLNKLFNKIIIIVSLGILANLTFILITTDSETILNLKKINFKYIMPIIGLLLLPWIGLSLRLMIWTRFLETPLNFKTCFQVAFTTDLGSSITPSLIGGGPLKMALLIKNKVPTVKAGTIMLLAAFEDFVMFSCAFMTAFFFLRTTILEGISTFGLWVKDHVVYILLIIIVLGFLFLIIRHYLFNRLSIQLAERIRTIGISIRKSLGEMGKAFQLIIQEGKLRFLLSFGILILQWIAKLSVLLVVLSALDLPFDAFQMYIRQWLVYLSMLLVPTPGATGGAEASFYFIFNGLLDKSYLPLVVSIWRFFTYYTVLFLAVFFVQTFQFFGKENEVS